MLSTRMKDYRSLVLKLFLVSVAVNGILICIIFPKITKHSPIRPDDSVINGVTRSVTDDKNLTRILELYHPNFKHWNTLKKSSLHIFIFSAILYENTKFNSTNIKIDSINGLDNKSLPLLSKYKHIIKINAWEPIKYARTPIKCCYLWKNNRTTTFLNPIRGYWKMYALSAIQYTCLLNKSDHFLGVSLQYKRGRCATTMANTVKPIFPKVQKQGSFAICLKIAFGNIDPRLLVDWMEYYKEMKVDKVFATTHNLSAPARKVFEYYAKTGFVQVEPFEYPWKHVAYHRRTVGDKVQRAYNDEQVVVFDCFERLRGYTYFAILDLDEFLLPAAAGDLKQLMGTLLRIYPHAAGFSFKSFLFIKDWGITGSANGSDIVKYIHRTGPLSTRTKNVVIPQRITEGSVLTHEFQAAQGYRRVHLSSQRVALYHYRYCYQNQASVCNKTKRRKDTRILAVVERMQSRTSKVLKDLKLSNTMT